MPLEPMHPPELRRATDALGLSLNQLAAFLAVDSRVVRRWANGEFPVSPVAARLLRIMVRLRHSVTSTRELTDAPLD